MSWQCCEAGCGIGCWFAKVSGCLLAWCKCFKLRYVLFSKRQPENV
ncbi:hypothetical protein GCWU000324_02227 [Kingella oralis ATCC 51147]|uniref:Uncharacterized protein n=1 Tax=Kingella oralis ATCC 51147 TaxID=629741 RepID=C4GJK4_9NEIS|nr:hypothetical protein GCWU000324_02227 [Kingella oralis ATCC 51147]